MATLPFDLSSKTGFQRRPAFRTSVATDGTLRQLNFSSTLYSRIDAVVESLDATDRDTLMAFLETNLNSEIDVTINGTTYRGLLMEDSAGKWRKVSGRYEVMFALWARAL